MSPLEFRVRELRKKAQLTQLELADAVGISQRQVSYLETGRQRVVDLDVLERIARVLGVAPGDLIRNRRR